MRRDAGIGAHRDPDARPDRGPDRRAVDVHDGAGLVEDVRRDRRSGLGGLDDPMRRDERRHQPCPAFEHELDALVVEKDPVLDRADARPHGVPDPVGGLGVGHDEDPGGGRLLHEHVELGRPQMRVARIVARRQDAARGGDLDHVGAHAVQLADLAAHLVGPVDDARRLARMRRHERDLGP
jgi:hypothetical protein